MNDKQVAKQGGYQPAIVKGLESILKEGDTFTSGLNHIDYPNTELVIPVGCIGYVEKSANNTIDGTVSILDAHTITARRLEHRSRESVVLQQNAKYIKPNAKR